MARLAHVAALRFIEIGKLVERSALLASSALDNWHWGQARNHHRHDLQRVIAGHHRSHERIGDVAGIAHRDWGDLTVEGNAGGRPWSHHEQEFTAIMIIPKVQQTG